MAEQSAEIDGLAAKAAAIVGPWRHVEPDWIADGCSATAGPFAGGGAVTLVVSPSYDDEDHWNADCWNGEAQLHGPPFAYRIVEIEADTPEEAMDVMEAVLAAGPDAAGWTVHVLGGASWDWDIGAWTTGP